MKSCSELFSFGFEPSGFCCSFHNWYADFPSLPACPFSPLSPLKAGSPLRLSLSRVMSVYFLPSFSTCVAFNPSPKSMRNSLSGILQFSFPGVYVLFSTFPPKYIFIGNVANAFSCATFTASVSSVPAATPVIWRVIPFSTSPTDTAAAVDFQVYKLLLIAVCDSSYAFCFSVKVVFNLFNSCFNLLFFSAFSPAIHILPHTFSIVVTSSCLASTAFFASS